MGKKSLKRKWRKADVADIEEHLEKERQESLRHGAPIVKAKDSSLFFVDKAPAAGQKRAGKTKKTKRDAALRSHAIFVPNPHVKPVKSQKRKVAGTPKSVHETRKVKKIAASVSKGISQEPGTKRGADDDSELDEAFDIWDQPEEPLVVVPPDVDADFVEPTIKKPVKKPATLASKPRSEAPAVKVPLPGASYNPTLDDHQDVLGMATALEIQKQDKAAMIRRVLVHGTTADDGQPALPPPADHSASDSDDSPNTDDATSAVPVAVNKRTKTQLNRKARRLAEEEAARKRAHEKQLLSDIDRLSGIVADVEAADAKPSKTRSTSRVARLGKRPFRPVAPEVLLSEELPGSLRLLKPEGNLFRDRYKSLQERQLIEPRDPAKKRRRFR